MRTTASHVALHGRHLNEVSASTVGEFTAAIADSSVNKILLAAGTYELTSDMCTGSAVCIDRALTIEAEVPGAVVLNDHGVGGRAPSPSPPLTTTPPITPATMPRDDSGSPHCTPLHDFGSAPVERHGPPIGR